LQRLQCLLPLHFKDFNVFFTFQRLSKSFVLQRLQCLLPLHFKDYQSLLSCRDFDDFYLYISKTLMSSLLCQDFNVFFQDFNVFFTLSRLQCLLSRLQCLLYFSKTSKSLVKTTMSSFTFQKTSMSSVICAFKRLQCLLSFTLYKTSTSFVLEPNRVLLNKVQLH